MEFRAQNELGSQALPGGRLVGLFSVAHFLWPVTVFSDAMDP